jgi:hypothetical protein
VKFPLDPYVTEVADLLAAAGVEVGETWTEATDPIDHNVEVKAGRWHPHLIWNGAGWKFIAYPREYIHAGQLLAGVRPDPVEVVAATVALLERLLDEG